jgi:hypothetical protein
MTKRLLIQTITTNAGRALVPASQAADTEHHFQRSLFGEARRLEGLKLNIADGTTRGDHRLREASDGLQTLVRNMTEVAQLLFPCREPPDSRRSGDAETAAMRRGCCDLHGLSLGDRQGSAGIEAENGQIGF